MPGSKRFLFTLLFHFTIVRDCFVCHNSLSGSSGAAQPVSRDDSQSEASWTSDAELTPDPSDAELTEDEEPEQEVKQDEQADEAAASAPSSRSSNRDRRSRRRHGSTSSSDHEHNHMASSATSKSTPEIQASAAGALLGQLLGRVLAKRPCGVAEAEVWGLLSEDYGAAGTEAFKTALEDTGHASLLAWVEGGQQQQQQTQQQRVLVRRGRDDSVTFYTTFQPDEFL